MFYLLVIHCLQSGLHRSFSLWILVGHHSSSLHKVLLMNLFRLDNLSLCVFGRLRFSSSSNLLVTIAFAFFFGCQMCLVKVFTMFCFVCAIICFRALIIAFLIIVLVLYVRVVCTVGIHVRDLSDLLHFSFCFFACIYLFVVSLLAFVFPMRSDTRFLVVFGGVTRESLDVCGWRVAV